MKKLFTLMLIMLPLTNGCSASIGPQPATTATTTSYTTPVVHSTTYTPVATKTTVTKTTY